MIPLQIKVPLELMNGCSRKCLPYLCSLTKDKRSTMCVWNDYVNHAVNVDSMSKDNSSVLAT